MWWQGRGEERETGTPVSWTTSGAKLAQDAKISCHSNHLGEPELQHATAPSTVLVRHCTLSPWKLNSWPEYRPNYHSLLITTENHLLLQSTHLKFQWLLQDLPFTVKILRHMLPCPDCPSDGGYSNMCAASSNLSCGSQDKSFLSIFTREWELHCFLNDWLPAETGSPIPCKYPLAADSSAASLPGTLQSISTHLSCSCCLTVSGYSAECWGALH